MIKKFQMKCSVPNSNFKKIFLVCNIFVLTFVFWLMITDLLRKQQNLIWMKDRESLMLKYFDHRFITNLPKSSNFPACVIPSLNVFGSEILHFMETRKLGCPILQYGSISRKGVYEISSNKKISNVKLFYISSYKANFSNEHVIKVSEPIHLIPFKNGKYCYKLNDDFIKVEMYVDNVFHVEFHAHISNKTLTRMRNMTNTKRKEMGFDIAFIMIYSQSHANVHRQLSNSVQKLLGDENTIILKGHTIVSDERPAQMAALFTGKFDKALPEGKIDQNHKSAICDQFNLIFNDFNKAGYVTMFNEDDVDLGTFNCMEQFDYLLATSWYTKPIWLGENKFKLFPKCASSYNNYLMKMFTETFEDVPKISFSTYRQISKADVNNLQTIDNEIVEMIDFYKSNKRIDHTIFVIFSNQGFLSSNLLQSTHGRLELILPFFSITLPPIFKHNYPKMFSALKKNANILTNSFDVYSSLKHLILYPNLPNNIFVGQSLFTDIDPTTRTCNSSGIKDHFCSCLKFEHLHNKNADLNKVALAVVNYLNKELQNTDKVNSLCATLVLDTVLFGIKKSINDKVLHYKRIEQAVSCDSCSNRFSKATIYYEVGLRVMPGGGEFEANVNIFPNGFIAVDPNIKRINLKGDLPPCIMDEFPQLRPFCYCKVTF